MTAGELDLRSSAAVAPASAAVCAHELEAIELRREFLSYFEAFATRRDAFLLDSATAAGGLGRFSFMGADPFAAFHARELPGSPDRLAEVTVTVWQDAAGNRQPVPDQSTYIAEPFEELRRVLDEYSIPPERLQPCPLPLLAGAVGYFAYEAGRFIERLPNTAVDDLGHPAIRFALFDLILGHDHEAEMTWISSVGRGADEAQARRRARRRLDAHIGVLRRFESSRRPARPIVLASAASADRVPVSAHFDRRAYAAAVRRCKRHIEAGDAYEICLTHRLTASPPDDPWALYRALRAATPAPFAAYLRTDGAEILCSSPERFLRLAPDGTAESRPIKGTRPRGATPADDRRLAHDLRTSEKDRAENVMIVDLVRNDLGRVCAYGTVHVPELLHVEPYATVFQLVSTVRGQLAAGRDLVDLIVAAFPGGSMTGAPKIQAMKIIDAIEPACRGVYSGSIGYIDFAGAIDFNIVIRTLICLPDRTLINVGGAIVADSDPLDEYDETMHKAFALKRALATAPLGS